MKSIIINCFPRSSLTFTRQNILDSLYIPDKKLIKTHSHAAFSDIKNQINIIRKPEDCIISDLVMQYRDVDFKEKDMVQRIQNSAEYYILYHTKMLKHLSYILPLTFEQTTQSIDTVVRAVSNHFDIPYAMKNENNTEYLVSHQKFLVSSKEAGSYNKVEALAKKNSHIFEKANAFYQELLLPSVLQRQEYLNLFSY